MKGKTVLELAVLGMSPNNFVQLLDDTIVMDWLKDSPLVTFEEIVECLEIDIMAVKDSKVTNIMYNLTCRRLIIWDFTKKIY